ncbi:hypothetical protein QVD17_25545 [Tagetes erecta]|uniref:Uncharacterized protein n=1 Tax=Tagetes erecta TaxID=13708 RepID=A0AAD8NVI4_TARER|nr:hypothetical protein QVD17_25545 [Tagetes erecta]
MESNYNELPEEIWELILNKLINDPDHNSQFESLSLVNKCLLSLTNRLRFQFTVIDQTYFIHGTISHLIHRFKHLKTLDLSNLTNSTNLQQYNVETAISVIARSSVCLNLEVIDVSNHEYVPIESLKELGLSNRRIKVLKCARIVKLCDADLIAIAKFQPDLEELDISDPRYKFETDSTPRFGLGEIMVTDAGIESLSTGLRNLKRINISMNPLVTDRCLYHLSLNCLRLEEVLFSKCIMITMKGVRFMVDNSLSLRSISMCQSPSIHGTESLFVDPVTSGKCLTSLCFTGYGVSDEFLDSIVKARLLLKSFSLYDHGDYSVDGLSRFLHAYQSIKFLDLSNNNIVCNESVVSLSQCLHDLVSIKLNFCPKVSTRSLFALIINCLCLEHIEMERTRLGKEDDQGLFMNSLKALHTKSRSIKSLYLRYSPLLTDKSLLTIASFCPNLNKLDVSSCFGLTWSLSEILNNCVEIEHLNIRDCKKVKNLGSKVEPLRLKKLCMARSGVNDEGLVGIADRCKELVNIDLERCQHVTTNAVKAMVKSCAKLREVNLKGCVNLHAYIVDWMVHTRRSLRKLVPPSYDVTTESQRELLLRHGCHVCDK